MRARIVTTKGFRPTEYGLTLPVAPMVTPMDVAQVTAFVTLEKGASIDVLARLYLSPEEARSLAARLVDAASKAEQQAQAQAQVSR
jgi:hypothetical protein